MKTSFISENRVVTLKRVDSPCHHGDSALASLLVNSPVCGTKEVCPALLVGAALLGTEAEVVGDGAAVIAARQGDELKIGEN